MPNYPIVNAGLKYVNNLDLSYLFSASATQMTMAAGAARDVTNTNDIILSAPATINGLYVGANGCDTAVLAVSSMYAVYVIGDSTDHQPTAGLLSLVANATPYLPFGYDMYRIVGYVSTDASAHILQFWAYGHGDERTFYYDVPLTVLSGGSETSMTALPLTLAASPHQLVVPPIACQVWLNVAYTPNTTNTYAEFLPFGSVATAGLVSVGTGVAAQVQHWSILVPCALSAGVPNVLYKVASSDAVTVAVAGFVVSKS